MAHNNRARVTTWAPLDVPTAAEFETMDANQAASVNGDVGGTWSPSSIIEIGSKGLSARHVYGLTVVGADADTTYPVSTARLIYLDATITVDRAYTLSATGAVVGDVMEIVALPSMSGARVITVKDNLAASLIGIGSGALAEARSAKFVYLGTQWRVLEANYKRNQIVQLNNAGVTTPAFTTTSITPVDVPSTTVTVVARAGDQIAYNASIQCKMSGGTGEADLVIVDGGGGQTIQTGFSTNDNYPPSMSLNGLYNVVTGGTITLRWKVASDNVSNTLTAISAFVLAQVTRP